MPDEKLREMVAREIHNEIPLDHLTWASRTDAERRRYYFAADAALAAIEPLLEAMRRHVRSFVPGTLTGSELNVAHHLRELDGDVWAPWCVSGDTVTNAEVEFKELAQMVEASGTHVVAPVEPTIEQRAAAARIPHARDEEIYHAMLAARPRDAD